MTSCDAGDLILGFMLDPNNVLTTGSTPGCDCVNNSPAKRFCPDCGSRNNDCKLVDGFSIVAWPWGPRRDLKLSKGRNGATAEIPSNLRFHEYACKLTHDGQLIIVGRTQVLPHAAQDSSFTTREQCGWSHLSMDGAESIREDLRRKVEDAGLPWDSKMFGVFAVRRKLFGTLDTYQTNAYTQQSPMLNAASISQ
jgi:hypothetical protein